MVAADTPAGTVPLMREAGFARPKRADARSVWAKVPNKQGPHGIKLVEERFDDPSMLRNKGSSGSNSK